MQSKNSKRITKMEIRLENKVAYMRNEISCLEHLKISTLRNTKVRERIIKKHHLEVKTVAESIETNAQTTCHINNFEN